MSEKPLGYELEVLDHAVAAGLAAWVAPGKDPNRGREPVPLPADVEGWLNRHPDLDTVIVESSVTYDLAVRSEGQWTWASTGFGARSFIGPSSPLLDDVEQARFFCRSYKPDRQVSELMVFRGVDGRWRAVLRTAHEPAGGESWQPRRRRYLVSTPQCAITATGPFTTVVQPNGITLVHPWAIEPGSHQYAHVREITFEDRGTGVRRTGAALFAGYETRNPS